jgi:hypothetical protein
MTEEMRDKRADETLERFEQIRLAQARALANAKASKQAHEVDVALRDSACKLAEVCVIMRSESADLKCG